MSRTTNPSRVFVLRGDRLSRIPTNCFRSSGDESTFDDCTAAKSRRAGRTFLIGLGTSCWVTTSQTVDETSPREDFRSTAPESTDVLRHFSSSDAIRDDDDTELVGCCCCGELAINLFSGRLNERLASLRLATAIITQRFTNSSITGCKHSLSGWH